MKKIMILAIAFIAATAFTLVDGEKYSTKTGKVSFYSSTPAEDIKAETNQANVILDAASGKIAVKILINSFEFDKALMQKHFNGKDYMDSKEYPDARFSGSIENYDVAKYGKDGKYNVTVKGTMEMHGVKKEITEKGTLEVKGGQRIIHTVFNLNRKDYNVDVPKMVSGKIAETIEVTVDATLTK